MNENESTRNARMEEGIVLRANACVGIEGLVGRPGGE